MKGILGRKIEMTQVFSETGKMIPVTVIEVLPNTVLQCKTIEKDGYCALKLGTGEKRENLINKPDMGNFKKANSTPKRFIKEIRDMNGYEIGALIKCSDVFKAGEIVDVTGVSKGKGTAGVIKRYNYSRGPMGHGSGYHRGIGSMGPIINRILKSKKMPGRLGHENKTIQNLEIVSIFENENVVLIKGSIPGPNKSFVIIKENVKKIKSNDAIKLLNRNNDLLSKNDEKTNEKEKSNEVKVEEIKNNELLNTSENKVDETKTKESIIDQSNNELKESNKEETATNLSNNESEKNSN